MLLSRRSVISLTFVLLCIAPLTQADKFSDLADSVKQQMNGPSGAGLSDADIGAGLKEAAADVFSNAVKKLTIDDVRGILGGGSDAATQYFKRTTGDTLTARFKPIVSGITAKSGLVQQYNSVISQAGPAASMLGPKIGEEGDVTQKALDGLFLRVADEEKDIRQHPAARSTALLKKVFGS